MNDPTSPEALARVLRSAKYVLLDFDGPVCSVFSAVPAAGVADSMRRQLGLADPPVTEDPLVVLHLAAAVSAAAGRQAHDLLVAAELTAIGGAEPTAGSAEFLATCHQLGRQVAIVSNNSGEAIAAYLADHRLEPLVAAICGRDSQDMNLMKPNPHVLLQALTALGSAPGQAVVIGDSDSDMAAAASAGTVAIGLANKTHKRTSLVATGAAAVVSSMAVITAALRSTSQR